MPLPAVSHCTSPLAEAGGGAERIGVVDQALRERWSPSRSRDADARESRAPTSPWYMLQPSLRLKSWPRSGPRARPADRGCHCRPGRHRRDGRRRGTGRPSPREAERFNASTAAIAGTPEADAPAVGVPGADVLRWGAPGADVPGAEVLGTDVLEGRLEGSAGRHGGSLILPDDAVGNGFQGVASPMASADRTAGCGRHDLALTTSRVLPGRMLQRAYRDRTGKCPTSSCRSSRPSRAAASQLPVRRADAGGRAAHLRSQHEGTPRLSAYQRARRQRVRRAVGMEDVPRPGHGGRRAAAGQSFRQAPARDYNPNDPSFSAVYRLQLCARSCVWRARGFSAIKSRS